MHTTMTKISTSVVYATVACTNLDQEERFYRESLGFDVEGMAGVPGVSTVHCGQNTNITLYERPTAPNCDTTVATFTVDDIEVAMQDLTRHGVNFLDYDLPYLKTVDGIAVQGNTKFCWFKDPAGNILSLVEM